MVCDIREIYWECVRVHAKSLQSCLTLCNPMDYNLPGSSVHGILQARILEWVASPFYRGSSQHRKIFEPRSPTLQADSLPCASPAAKLSCFKSCLTLCNPIDGSLPGSPVPGILQARTLEWVAISFSNAWKWKVKVKSLQSCLTLRHPMDCSLPGSSVHGILQARIRSGLSVPSTGDLPNPGIKPRSPTLQADSLPSASPGKTAIIIFSLQMIIQAQRIKV